MSLKDDKSIISYEEFKRNELKYQFNITELSKEDLGMASSPGQTKKIEKLTERVHTRISEIEKNILEIGAKEKEMSQSEFLRFLILQHGKEEIKEKIEQDYNNRVEEYNNKEKYLKKLEMYRFSLLDLRGADERTANKLYKERTTLKYEIQNIKSELNHLKIYLDKYNFIFS